MKSIEFIHFPAYILEFRKIKKKELREVQSKAIEKLYECGSSELSATSCFWICLHRSEMKKSFLHCWACSRIVRGARRVREGDGSACCCLLYSPWWGNLKRGCVKKFFSFWREMTGVAQAMPVRSIAADVLRKAKRLGKAVLSWRAGEFSIRAACRARWATHTQQRKGCGPSERCGDGSS